MTEVSLLLAEVRNLDARGQLDDRHLDHLHAWCSQRIVASVPLGAEFRAVLRNHGREA